MTNEINPGDEVIIEDPNHWAYGETGIVLVAGKAGIQVQLSSCQGKIIVSKKKVSK